MSLSSTRDDLIQSAAAFVKNWQWVVLSGLLAVCAVIWIVADQRHLLDAAPALLSLDGLLYLAARLSQLALYGFSTVMFTKYLGGMGIFRDALSDLLGEDKWLDRRNDLEALWSNVTRRIYLPNFKLSAPEAVEFQKRLNRAFGDVISHRSEGSSYYIRNTRLRFDVTWHDEARNEIAVEDFMACTIVPFDPDIACRYDIRVHIASSDNVEDFKATLKLLELNGDKIDLDRFKKSDDGKAYELSLELKGRTTHVISRTLSMTHNITTDPLFIVGPSRVAWGMNVIVNVLRPNIRTNFEEVASVEVFKPVGICTPARFERDTDAVLLPEQGFMLVFAKTA